MCRESNRDATIERLREALKVAVSFTNPALTRIRNISMTEADLIHQAAKEALQATFCPIQGVDD